MNTLACSKCHQVKPVSEFYRDRRSNTGHRTKCKTCEKAYKTANAARISQRDKAYRAANREKIHLRDERRYHAFAQQRDPLVTTAVCTKCHEEKLLAEFQRDRTHHNGHKTHCKACCHQYYSENVEHIKGRQSHYYRANGASIRIKSALYRQQKPEVGRNGSRAFRKRHPGRARIYDQRFRQRFPEYSAIKNERRRAMKLNAPVNDFTRSQWQAMKEHYGHRCVYCGREMDRLTMDHILPLSKGGGHTLSNIVPACRSCNGKKNAGPPLVPVQPLLLL